MPQQRAPVGRHRLRRRDDRGVRHDPAGRDVALLGDLVAGLPQRADGAERPAAADPVQARRTAPRVDARRRARSCAGGRTPGAPSRPCRPPPARRPARRAARPAPRRRGRRTRATARAAAASTSRRRSAPSPAGSRAASRPGWPGRPGGSRAGGRPARCRTARVGRQPDLGEAGQVLGGGVQDPLGAVERLLQRRQRVEARSGRPGGCRRPRGAAGSGRRGWSSGSPRRARRRSRPGRCPAAIAAHDLAQRLVGARRPAAARRAA